LRNAVAGGGKGVKIKVLIADDHDVVRAGVKSLLARQEDVEIVGEASDGRQVVRMAEELSPSIVVMDIAMPQLNGIDAAGQILRHEPETKVIVLSMYADEEFLVRALTAGVKGYLLKDSVQADLLRAVRAVATGRSFFSPEIAQTLAEDYVRQLQQKGIEDSYELLTEREREVLQLLAEGMSNKEAASVLNVSPYTVETHRTHLMQKLNLHNTAEIVLYAVRKKIVT
jgi:DNA-binding NarL/FixJ family response regulator